MTMPITLTWIRHGKSESNETTSLAKKGNPHPNEAALKKAHTHRRRLTDLGILQARKAGEWVFADLVQRACTFEQNTFESCRFFTSPYVRAMETALEMNLPVRWRPDSRVCERNWGSVDRLTYDEQMERFKAEIELREADAEFWGPEIGIESLLQVKARLRQFFDMLNRQCSDHHVYIACHGETMWSARSLLEYWMPDEFADRMINENANLREKMLNCRIVQYTRQITDGSPQLDDHLCRVRLINPMQPEDPDTNLDWQKVERREFNNRELRAYVDRFPHFLRENSK